MNEQVSMFSLLNAWETPLMKPEEMKKGVSAWIIEAAFPTNSIGPNAPIQYCVVRPRKVVFIRDSKLNKYGIYDTYAENIGGRYFGWYGGRGRKYIFARKPTWNDCETFVRREAKDCGIDMHGIEIRPWIDPK